MYLKKHIEGISKIYQVSAKIWDDNRVYGRQIAVKRLRTFQLRIISEEYICKARLALDPNYRILSDHNRL